jgi:hypothetical protein
MSLNASSIGDVLTTLTDPELAPDVTKFQQGMAAARSDSSQFISESSADLEQWLVDLHNKDMTELEFNNLVNEQEIVSRSFVLQQSLVSQQRATDLTLGLLQIAITKIAPAVLLAIA